MGSITLIGRRGIGRFRWQPRRLTYKGHEFLDTVRDEEIWRRTKAGGVGLGLLLEIEGLRQAGV
ncbi:DUF2513 domain-containing protein [Pseudomonas syringae]|uniref:DUF2513 domain-containing protein n=1 Tax=Pseudomonas syringae TaxID=317 RepID=UPI001FCD89B8|nr:DUF2513 domain-containing protein [Pseudomonas syringae]MCK0551051.1 DUF2513 domain-containing protein [Pseudomonas syringae pv. aptata]